MYNNIFYFHTVLSNYKIDIQRIQKFESILLKEFISSLFEYIQDHALIFPHISLLHVISSATDCIKATWPCF